LSKFCARLGDLFSRAHKTWIYFDTIVSLVTFHVSTDTDPGVGILPRRRRGQEPR